MYEKLIERLREYPDREETVGGYVEIDWQDLSDAADAIESLTAQLAALQVENAEMRTQHRTEHCEAAGYDCAELGRLRGEIERLKSGGTFKLLRQTQRELTRVEAERDAAEADLNIAQDCRTCGNKTMWCEDNPDRCKGYKWRGAQGEG